MNKNEVFKKFIQNPLLKENVELNDNQLNSMDLSTPCANRLIDVLKTTIINLDDHESVDLVARKINQSFKRETI